MGGWNKRNEIKKNKLILAEGNDAYYFCIWALEAYKVEDVQVMDFGGNEQLKDFLSLLKNFAPGSENVERILIIRDAETNADAAQRRIRSDLISSGYHAPEQPFVFSGDKPQIAYALFPGEESNGTFANGTLEDLCLSTIKDDPIMEHVSSLVRFFNEEGISLRHPHKTKLHAYLAFKDPFVGMKLGEAARARAFNWEHSSMKNFNKIINDLS